MDSIQFSTNWNNKLDCDYFTTIRINSTKYYQGKIFNIELKNEVLFQAEAVKVGIIKMQNLNDYMCYLDTGYNTTETVAIFKKMCPNIDFTKTNLVLVLLKKIKKNG